MSKSQILELFGRDDLEQVIESLRAYAGQHQVADLYSDVIIQSGQLEAVKKAMRVGATPYETLSMQRAAVRQNLLELVQGLPEQPPGPLQAGRKKGVSEHVFKNALFWLMVAGKLGLVGWLSFEVSAGGFAPREFSATISLLLPVFSAYLTPMVAEYIKHRHVSAYSNDAPEKRLTWRLPLFTLLIVLPVYFGCMFSAVQMRGSGEFTFEQMTGRLMLLETVIGVYLGMIIGSVFGSAEKRS